MSIKTILEATCDLCGEKTTYHTPGHPILDPTTPYYGGEHTEYGWVCEKPVCRAQVAVMRATAALATALRK